MKTKAGKLAHELTPKYEKQFPTLGDSTNALAFHEIVDNKITTLYATSIARTASCN
jgi:hypothetical protein